MTDKSVHDATEEWVRHSITKEFAPIDINDVYKAFAAGAQWQSQQVQGEVVAYYDPRPGVDWAYRFLEPDEIEQEDNRNFFTVPLIANQPAPAAVPEGWKLVPVEPTLGMLAALAWAGDEDLALGHAEINREIISNYGAMLAASPAPEHSGDSNEMVVEMSTGAIESLVLDEFISWLLKKYRIELKDQLAEYAKRQQEGES